MENDFGASLQSTLHNCKVSKGMNQCIMIRVGVKGMKRKGSGKLK